jgi:putative ABC transport system permease protein
MSTLAGIFLIVRRSLRQHALSTAVTLGATALACGLVMAVFSIQRQSYEAFTGGSSGFDAVLGARGSQLQLVLNTVFHLETSPGNIPWSLYQDIKNDPRVELAVPYATGDNYLGFRIVGTTTEIFDDFEFNTGERFEVEEGGRFFDPGYAEAVIGSFVARETGLGFGDTFSPYHGLAYNPDSQHAEEYTIVGVLEPTNTPNDRVIWIPIEGIFRMGGHVLRGTGDEAGYVPEAGEAIPDEHKEVSAVMLNLRTPTAGFELDRLVNKQGKVATFAFPVGLVMADLFNKIGWVNRVFELVAYLVVLVSAGAILASIYNTINERRREFAILRALGARRATVFSAIVIEAATIAGMGAALGFVVYATILGATAVVVRAQTGVVLEVLRFHPIFILAPAGMIALGALSGILPAIKAYTTDVADNLVPHS